MQPQACRTNPAVPTCSVVNVLFSQMGIQTLQARDRQFLADAQSKGPPPPLLTNLRHKQQGESSEAGSSKKDTWEH